jgi:hypothetical protein
MSDELEASRLRHPSAGGPPPAFIAAGQAVYGRRERQARHLAEQSGMSIEAARKALIKGGLDPEVIEEHMADSVMGLGVWWCTAHNDDLDVCAAVPLGPPPYCAPVWTTAPHCAGCRVPEDQPHRSMCARVLGAGDPEGDVAPDRWADVARRLVHPGGPREILTEHAASGDEVAATVLSGPLFSVPEAALLRDDVMNPDTDAAHLAALGVTVDVGHGPETQLCGAQLDRSMVFCTKRFRHAEAGDDVHYDHRAKKTWRVAASL